MVLQLCGRVCRRLSLKNPHHLFDGDFLRCDFLVLKSLDQVQKLGIRQKGDQSQNLWSDKN
jgi:hypothetical protein